MNATDPEIIPLTDHVETPIRAVDYYFVVVRGFNPETVSRLIDKGPKTVSDNVEKAENDLDGLEPVEPRGNYKNDRQGSRLYSLISSGVNITPAVDYYLAEIEDMDLAAVAMVRGKSISGIESSLKTARAQLGEDNDGNEPEQIGIDDE